MINRGLNIIIGFGAVIAVGLAIAIYRILTMRSMENTILAIAIAIAVAISLLLGASVAYYITYINHKRRLYRIDTEAKQIALDALRTQQYMTGTQFDTDHAQHVLNVLYGHVIEPKNKPKEIMAKPIILSDEEYTREINKKEARLCL